MEFKIDSHAFQGLYTKEQVQEFIDNKLIGPETKIWSLDWAEWREIKDTDFDTGMIVDKVIFTGKYLSFIDNGDIFRKPFSYIYTFFAIFNLFIPVYIFFKASNERVFKMPGKFVFVFFLVWLSLAFVSWVSFQLWQDRKTKFISLSNQGGDFLVTQLFSHFIQTIGEWLGTWIGIFGFSVSLFTLLFLERQSYLLKNLGLGFFGGGLITLISMPVIGFLIIVISRFAAERFRVFVTIANNTKKSG